MTTARPGAREWLALSQLPGIGPARLAEVAARAAAWPDGWLVLLPREAATALRLWLDHPAQSPLSAEVERAEAWLAAGPDRHLLHPGHPAWPRLLGEIADPPPLLWGWGDLDALSPPRLAMVGRAVPPGRGWPMRPASPGSWPGAAGAWSAAWPWGSTRPPSSSRWRRAGPAPRCSAAASTWSTRPATIVGMSACASRAGCCSPSTRPAPRRGRPTFPAAIASSPASPAACWWWKPPSGAAPWSAPGWPPSRAARSSPCRAPSTTPRPVAACG